jgi:integrase
MFLFAVAHGARASEIANLRLSDPNLKRGAVHIARLKGSLDSTQNLLKVKGNPLFDEEKAFRTWLGEIRPDANSFIFNSQKSTRINRATICKLFRGICEAAKIEEKTLWHAHVLKHSLAMRLVEQKPKKLSSSGSSSDTRAFRARCSMLIQATSKQVKQQQKRSRRFSDSPCSLTLTIGISRNGFTPPVELEAERFKSNWQ